jgi:hypothetical protein
MRLFFRLSLVHELLVQPLQLIRAFTPGGSLFSPPLRPMIFRLLASSRGLSPISSPRHLASKSSSTNAPEREERSLPNSSPGL